MPHPRTGNIHEMVIADQRELMNYLHVEHGEGREGSELLPLLKSIFSSALSNDECNSVSNPD